MLRSLLEWSREHHASHWTRALGYSSVLSKDRGIIHALVAAHEAMRSSTKPTGNVASEAVTAIGTLLRSPARNGAVPGPATLESAVKDLWADLAKFPWLSHSPWSLDEHALRQILMMGPNPAHLQCQMLAELAESSVVVFLHEKSRIYGLGVEVPNDCMLEFVPGHAFRAGDKVPDISNRQISDGVLGYWKEEFLW